MSQMFPFSVEWRSFGAFPIASVHHSGKDVYLDTVLEMGQRPSWHNITTGKILKLISNSKLEQRVKSQLVLVEGSRDAPNAAIH